MTLRVPLAALVALLAVGLAACGDSDGGGQSSSAQRPPSAAEFPPAKGKTMMQLRRGLGAGGPVLAPTVQQLDPGKQRYGFALFTTARKQISGIPVALYVQRSGSTKLTGPFAARDLELTVAPPHQSETVAKDPDAAKSLYVARLPFPKAGA